MSPDYNIHFPEKFNGPILPLPERFNTLFKHLDPLLFESPLATALLRINRGESLQFGYYQTTTREAYTIEMDTSKNDFMFIFGHYGKVTWECTGHTSLIHAEAGKYTGLALRPGRQRLHIRPGSHGFFCIIVSEFRMELASGDLPYLKPLYIRSLDPSAPPLVLHKAPMTKKISVAFHELSRLSKKGIHRNLRYKEVVHYMLSVYNTWLEDQEINWRKYPEKIRERAKTFIATEYANPDLSVNDIAVKLGVCQTKLYRAFRHEDGHIRQYVTTCRVDAACSLLRDTDIDIAAIAFLVGYKETAYFSSIFRKVQKISPTMFRKQHRKSRRKKQERYGTDTI